MGLSLRCRAQHSLSPTLRCHAALTRTRRPFLYAPDYIVTRAGMTTLSWVHALAMYVASATVNGDGEASAFFVGDRQ